MAAFILFLLGLYAALWLFVGVPVLAFASVPGTVHRLARRTDAILFALALAATIFIALLPGF